MSNVTVNLTAMDALSLQLLNASVVANCFWLITGSIATVNNLLLMAAVLYSKREMNNFRRNMLHLAVADMIVGMIQLSIGIKRLFHTFLEIPETSSPKRCGIDMGAVIFGLEISVAQTFCLAADRFIAVLMPVFYRNKLKPEFSQAINYVAWAVCIFATSVGMTFGTKEVLFVPSCTMAGVFTPIFFQGFVFYLALQVLITFSGYIAIVLVVRQRIKKARMAHQSIVNVKVELQTHVLDTLKYIVILFIITWLLTSLAADFVAVFAPTTYSAIIIPYLVGATGVNSAVNFLVYLGRNKEIREDFLRLLRRGAEITPSSNNTSLHHQSHLGYLGHLRRTGLMSPIGPKEEQIPTVYVG